MAVVEPEKVAPTQACVSEHVTVAEPEKVGPASYALEFVVGPSNESPQALVARVDWCVSS